MDSILSFRDFLWISIGAVLGANLRYLVGRVSGRFFSHSFPVATLLINITGSFLLGLFFMWARERLHLDARWRLIIAVGFCGGYTTFSSFAWEALVLYRQGSPGQAVMYIVATNLLGMAGVIAGAFAGQRI